MVKTAFLSFMLLLLVLCNSCEWTNLKIINNPAYSIGLITNERPGGQTGALVGFEYSVNGVSQNNTYENGDFHWNVPSSGLHIGDKYMVQYDSLNPSTARMLFSYSVADSTDYKKYVTLFKTNPPGYPSP